MQESRKVDKESCCYDVVYVEMKLAKKDEVEMSVHIIACVHAGITAPCMTFPRPANTAQTYTSFIHGYKREHKSSAVEEKRM